MINSGLNRVILVGKLGHQPKLTYLSEGLAKTTLSLTCQSKHRDPQGKLIEKIDWVPIILWEEEAERIHQVCRKGSMILVEGQLHSHKEGFSSFSTVGNLFVEGQRVMILDQRPLPLQDQDSARPIGNVNPLEALFTPANSDEVPF